MQTPVRTSLDGEQIDVLRVPIDTVLAALHDNKMRNDPLLIALQWLALNRDRVAAM